MKTQFPARLEVNLESRGGEGTYVGEDTWGR